MVHGKLMNEIDIIGFMTTQKQTLWQMSVCLSTSFVTKWPPAREQHTKLENSLATWLADWQGQQTSLTWSPWFVTVCLYVHSV